MILSIAIIALAVSADDPAAIRDRIHRNMESTESKLKDRDPGDATRELQQKILADIDKLLEQNNNQPPPPQSVGGGSGSPPQSPPPPQGGASNSRRQQRRQQQQQQKGQQPPPQGASGQQPQPQQPQGDEPKPAGQQAGNPRDARPLPRGPDQFADVVKDVWGHLPESVRQEADHYYRERFMPRYRDLVQEYYKRVSERDRQPPERR